MTQQGVNTLDWLNKKNKDFTKHLSIDKERKTMFVFLFFFFAT